MKRVLVQFNNGFNGSQHYLLNNYILKEIAKYFFLGIC